MKSRPHVRPGQAEGSQHAMHLLPPAGQPRCGAHTLARAAAASASTRCTCSALRSALWSSWLACSAFLQQRGVRDSRAPAPPCLPACSGGASTSEALPPTPALSLLGLVDELRGVQLRRGTTLLRAVQLISQALLRLRGGAAGRQMLASCAGPGAGLRLHSTAAHRLGRGWAGGRRITVVGLLQAQRARWAAGEGPKVEGRGQRAVGAAETGRRCEAGLPSSLPLGPATPSLRHAAQRTCTGSSRLPSRTRAASAPRRPEGRTAGAR